MLTLTEGWLVTFGFLALRGLATGEGLLVGLGALVLITWVVAWSWNRASLARVSYEREAEPTRAFIGESIHVRMRISNKKALPVPWVRVAAASSEPASPPTRAVPSMASPVNCAIICSTGPPGSTCTTAKLMTMIPNNVGMISSNRRTM